MEKKIDFTERKLIELPRNKISNRDSYNGLDN